MPLWTAAQQVRDEVSKHNHLAEQFVSSRPDSAFYYGKLAFDAAERVEDAYNMTLAQRTIGRVFYEQGAYDHAVDYLTRSLDAFTALQMPVEIARTLLSLGNAHQSYELWEKALSEYRRAKTLFLELNDSSGIAEAYGTIGHYYEKHAQYDSAIYYQNQALAIYQNLEDDRGLAIIYDNIGSVHEDLGRFAVAFDYFMLSAHYDSISGNLPALVNTLNNLGDTYRKRGILEEAGLYTKLALRVADSLGLRYQVLRAYHDLTKLYRMHGMEDMALAYFDSTYDYSEELFSSQVAGQIANFQTLYETQEKEQAITQLRAKQEIASQTRNFLAASILIFLVFAFIVFRQEKLKRRKEKQFFEAEQSLNEAKLKNAELSRKALTTELENKRLKEEQFHLELESRSQDLTTKTLHIIQKNRILKELKKSIEDIEKEPRSRKKSLTKINSLIDESARFDHDWEEFESRFDQVHAQFLDRLKQRFPVLSHTEMRLASLIKMQLSSKDIATILGISQDSLRISRYRLKKKLELGKGQKLKTFLEELV